MSFDEITAERMCLYCSIFCLWSVIAEALTKALSITVSHQHSTFINNKKKNETKFVNPKFQNRNENFNFFNIYTKLIHIIVASFNNQKKNKRNRVKFHGEVYLTELFRFCSVVAL
jgi:hypothetical protein